MRPPTVVTIKTYMLVNVEEHRDPITDEINTTNLAEDAYWALEPSSSINQEIPEIYFELALEVQNQERV